MITFSFESVEQLGDFVALAGGAAQDKAQLDRIEVMLNTILANERTILMNEDLMAAALSKIDAATTKAGTGMQVLADTTQKISDEIDALKAALSAANVPQALVDQAAALGVKAQAVSDALDAHATFLTAVASKGAVDPVPVPVPPASNGKTIPPPTPFEDG